MRCAAVRPRIKKNGNSCWISGLAPTTACLVHARASPNPEDRKTGAMICGQLMIREAIPRLRELLQDRSDHQVMGGPYEELTIVLHVPKAAKQALEKLGQETGLVSTELPGRGHLKYDEWRGEYVVVFDDDENNPR